MNFKPNLKKISVSILISLILSVLYKYTDYQGIMWKIRADGTYPSFFEYSLWSSNLISIIISIIPLFIIIYIIWSMIEKEKKRKK